MEKRILKEFCAENFTNIPLAVARGAGRIELCDNLAVGGTTPPAGVIAETVRYAQRRNVPVMVMIRPRAGDFSYNIVESRIMEEDIRTARRLQAEGVVFGCLKKDWLDEELLLRLIKETAPLAITFHMVFDALSHSQQLKAIDWLADHGVSRILTHGGALNEPLEEHIDWLKQLIAHAKGRLVILPGGGITPENQAKIIRALDAAEIHGTKVVDLHI